MSTTLSIRPQPAQRPQRLADVLPMAAPEDPAAEDPAAEDLAAVPNTPPSPWQTPPSTRQTPPSTRQISELISAISVTTLSSESFSQHLSSHLSSTDPLAPPLAEPVTEATIAAQYGQTCISLWQLAQHHAQWDSPNEPLPPSLSPPLVKVSGAQQQVTQQLTQLCLLWAIGKWQQPSHTVFAQHPTVFATLQATWQNPTIQSALRDATTHLLQSPQDRWIATHMDCWAYLLGNVMHQLLQWNYQLTPSVLGEFLQRDEGNPDDITLAT